MIAGVGLNHIHGDYTATYRRCGGLAILFVTQNRKNRKFRKDASETCRKAGHGGTSNKIVNNLYRGLIFCSKKENASVQILHTVYSFSSFIAVCLSYLILFDDVG